MKLLIAATIFAAVLPAATINFSTANTTLAGGETITIGAASSTFTAIPASLTLQITGNTAVNGSPLTAWAIDVPWDVDGEASLLHVTGVFQPSGGNWSIYSIAWPATALAATNIEFGYPVLIKAGGMLSPVAGGALGSTDDGPLLVNVGLATPEPGTFAFIGIGLIASLLIGRTGKAVSSSEPTYKVCWTGHDGKQHCGAPISKDLALAWIEQENAKYAQLRHCAVPTKPR